MSFCIFSQKINVSDFVIKILLLIMSLEISDGKIKIGKYLKVLPIYQSARC